MFLGLFSQSISMSGGLLNVQEHWGLQSGADAVQNAFILGSKLGTNTTSKDLLLEILHNASAADVVIASNNMGIVSKKSTCTEMYLKNKGYLIPIMTFFFNNSSPLDLLLKKLS